MSSEQTELVRRFYESWNRQDLDAVLDCADPEIEFDWSASRAPFRGVYKGREQMLRFWTEAWEAWDRFALELEGVIECDPDHVVTPTIARGRGRGSGIEIEARGAMLWRLREGKIIGGKLFQTKEEALDAARARR